MKNQGIRQYTRVNFKRDVHLYFEGKQYTHNTVNNLSLGGMYVQGVFEQKKGDICTVELSNPDEMLGIELRARCSVVRVNGDGVALSFLSMGHESFLFLQTILLYEADDPMQLGTEFVKNINFELEPDEDETE
ncbi:MAG: PilZ domain-containing protein [Candidatus Electrothrix sp. AW2]|nr:PilZ domain-containing protein [Candidatus Electrothrix sp. AX1]MCI5117499.1 PilZ domain-containing protein [Candidatus Electrothrix gigas]MCI5127540.1 PilZ domain-containing protein [Candidatus Electrothrix gigas]MCI5135520.1 PilZ domain-containing protein [Candidatus Electrothrix gigas]MCI5183301.1 PilZ domain-containing protein [Candidatus Electrothrix gigas]